jgi:hypothetical protein
MSNYSNPWQIGAAGAVPGLQAASQNTITLSGLNSANGVELDWNILREGLNSNVKKYEVYEISKDLLALSVCWARYRKEREQAFNILSPTITKLLDSELFRLVTEDDIVQANVIRDYYSKKIMVWKLKNINLTPFRQDLNTFIHSDGKTFKESMLPLAYRLPEFYDYDVEFEQMSFEYNKELKRCDSQFVTDSKQLKFVKQLSVNTKRQKRKEYWFSDTHNNLVTFSIETHNPLVSLLDMTLKNNDINVIGRYKKSMRDGNEYLKVEKFSFV